MGGLIASVGFEEMPDNSALDEHIYCCLMEPGICDLGDVPYEKVQECNTFHKRKMQARKDDA